MNETIVYVDIDATLVDTKTMPLLALNAPPNRALLWYRLRRYMTIARPSAQPFLTELKKQFRLQSLTLGLASFQKKVLRSLHLDEFFEDVYGPDNFDKIGRPDNWVLIDDAPPDGPLAAVKLSWMGISRYAMSGQEWEHKLNTHYIQCKPFKGEGDPGSLIELIETVIEKVEAQTNQSPDELK